LYKSIPNWKVGNEEREGKSGMRPGIAIVEGKQRRSEASPIIFL
jgi:hypothetical protein